MPPPRARSAIRRLFGSNGSGGGDAFGHLAEEGMLDRHPSFALFKKNVRAETRDRGASCLTMTRPRSDARRLLTGSISRSSRLIRVVLRCGPTYLSATCMHALSRRHSPRWTTIRIRRSPRRGRSSRHSNRWISPSVTASMALLDGFSAITCECSGVAPSCTPCDMTSRMERSSSQIARSASSPSCRHGSSGQCIRMAASSTSPVIVSDLSAFAGCLRASVPSSGRQEAAITSTFRSSSRTSVS